MRRIGFLLLLFCLAPWTIAGASPAKETAIANPAEEILQSPVGKMFALADKLEITDEQLLLLRHLFKEQRERMRELRDNLKKSREDLRHALKQDKIEDIALHAPEVGKLQGLGLTHSLAFFVALRKTLTEPQWKKIQGLCRQKQIKRQHERRKRPQARLTAKGKKSKAAPKVKRQHRPTTRKKGHSRAALRNKPGNAARRPAVRRIRQRFAPPMRPPQGMCSMEQMRPMGQMGPMMQMGPMGPMGQVEPMGPMEPMRQMGPGKLPQSSRMPHCPMCNGFFMPQTPGAPNCCPPYGMHPFAHFGMSPGHCANPDAWQKHWQCCPEHFSGRAFDGPAMHQGMHQGTKPGMKPGMKPGFHPHMKPNMPPKWHSDTHPNREPAKALTPKCRPATADAHRRFIRRRCRPAADCCPESAPYKPGLRENRPHARRSMYAPHPKNPVLKFWWEKFRELVKCYKQAPDRLPRQPKPLQQAPQKPDPTKE